MQVSPKVTISHHQEKLFRLLENHQAAMRQKLLLARRCRADPSTL
jgi:hypothetical protein